MKLNPFRKESLKRYLGTDKHFVKTLGAFDLLTIGIGAVIGTGILFYQVQWPQKKRALASPFHF